MQFNIPTREYYLIVLHNAFSLYAYNNENFTMVHDKVYIICYTNKELNENNILSFKAEQSTIAIFSIMLHSVKSLWKELVVSEKN